MYYRLGCRTAQVLLRWVTSHMKESRCTCMSYVTYEWDTHTHTHTHTYTHTNTHTQTHTHTHAVPPKSVWDESRHICMGHVTYEWGISHSWMRHIAHKNEACHSATLMNEVCPLHIGMSRVCMKHVTHMNEVCHVREMTHVKCMEYRSRRRTAQVLLRWVTSHMKESLHICMSYITYEWGMLRMWHDSCHMWM